MAVADFRSVIPVPVEDLFAWHGRPGAFERLAPPWVGMRIVREGGSLRDGSVVFDIEKGPFETRWEASLGDYVENEQFVDEQVSGPFETWRHTHKFRRITDSTSEVHDSISYGLPVAPLGGIAAGWYVRRQLDRLFRFRHRRTREDCVRHFARRQQPRLKVLVGGAGGLVGSALVAFLRGGGHQVERLVRSKEDADTGAGIFWNPMEGRIDATRLEGFDAVVNLAGESIAERWTAAARERIRLSRVNGTTALSSALARLKQPPRVLISASGIGYYGNRQDTPLWETSEPGEGFLPDLARDWEGATATARAAGIRVVNLRIGIVLSAKGGALAKMLPAFLSGVGGPAGDGRQFMSWITLNDLVGVIHHALFDSRLMGPVNAVGPKPVSNREFASTLGRVLHRPAFLPLPAGVVRGLFGEMGQRLLLEGARVLPKRLSESSFEFCSNDLEDALRAELGL